MGHDTRYRGQQLWQVTISLDTPWNMFDTPMFDHFCLHFVELC